MMKAAFEKEEPEDFDKLRLQKIYFEQFLVQIIV